MEGPGRLRGVGETLYRPSGGRGQGLLAVPARLEQHLRRSRDARHGRLDPLRTGPGLALHDLSGLLRTPPHAPRAGLNSLHIRASSWSSHMEQSEMVALIRGGVPGPGGIWADLGAGTGNFSWALAELLG